MPTRHRYKCLNPNCPSLTRASRSLTFVAMNSPQPSCPNCGSIKLENWGEAVEAIVAGEAWQTAKNTDANLRRVADRYGMTDMNNKDGQAVKRRAAPMAASGPMTSVGGYQVPASTSGACHRLPITAPLTAPVNAPNTNKSAMMKGMTRVVAAHKDSA